MGGPGWLYELYSYITLTTHTSLPPIPRGFTPGFVNYKKGCSKLAASSDKAYQLLAHGRWFSPGTPTSSTTKAGHHDIAELLLKGALNTKNENQSKSMEAYMKLIDADGRFYDLGCSIIHVQFQTMQLDLHMRPPLLRSHLH